MTLISRRLLPISLVALLVAAGCKRQEQTEKFPPAPEVSTDSRPGATPKPAPKPETPKVPVSKAPAPKEMWKQFSGEMAMEHTRAQFAIGPRPSGSAELEQVRKLITTALDQAGWEVERQEFTDETPRGPIKFVNLIGRFAADGSRPVPRDTQRAIVSSHYDTKRYTTIKFSGANDGASSTGALIELARVLALDPAMAAKVELVFFDGEEAIQQFGPTDGLYGSRYYARSLRDAERVKQFEFGILLDMIGDKDLTITLSPDSPAEITRDLLASAEALKLRHHFTYHVSNIWDDHVPLNQVGIPSVDLIDFDYLFWHTQDDTLDKLSPESLQKIGSVTLHLLQQKLRK